MRNILTIITSFCIVLKFMNRATRHNILQSTLSSSLLIPSKSPHPPFNKVGLGDIKGSKSDLKKFSYHFIGVGGIGMSAIAQVLKEQGHIVSGSDRNYDKQITLEVFFKLLAQGISIHPQDGSGINENTDYVVISSAIEEDNPDIKRARVFNKKIIKRADLLAEMFNPKYGIAIG